MQVGVKKGGWCRVGVCVYEGSGVGVGVLFVHNAAAVDEVERGGRLLACRGGRGRGHVGVMWVVVGLKGDEGDRERGLGL